MSNPLLVATDGGRSAANAIELAANYSASERAPVEIVCVVAPLSDLPMALPHMDELEQARAQGVAEAVRQHVRDTVGPVDWPVHVRLGRPAPAICTTARARNARVIILGVDPRWSEGNATAVELLHLSEVPVLVVHGATLPRAAVVGVDFRASSMHAAAEAARWVGKEGVVHLVHVKSELDFPAASVWGWGQCYECAVDGAFDGLAERLRGIGVAEVQRHCRSGDPATELMSAAQEHGADILAIGSDGYKCNNRVVVGRVTRHILADASTSVLATPVVTTMEGPFADLPTDASSGRPGIQRNAGAARPSH